MARKYSVHNQLTGLQEEVLTWEEAKQLREKNRAEYIAHIESLFAITILIENSDGSWTQSLTDANGDPDTIQYFVDQNTA
jgi:hypothetical protein